MKEGTNQREFVTIFNLGDEMQFYDMERLGNALEQISQGQPTSIRIVSYEDKKEEDRWKAYFKSVAEEPDHSAYFSYSKGNPEMVRDGAKKVSENLEDYARFSVDGNLLEIKSLFEEFGRYGQVMDSFVDRFPNLSQSDRKIIQRTLGDLVICAEQIRQQGRNIGLEGVESIDYGREVYSRLGLALLEGDRKELNRYRLSFCTPHFKRD